MHIPGTGNNIWYTQVVLCGLDVAFTCNIGIDSCWPSWYCTVDSSDKVDIVFSVEYCVGKSPAKRCAYMPNTTSYQHNIACNFCSTLKMVWQMKQLILPVWLYHDKYIFTSGGFFKPNQI